MAKGPYNRTRGRRTAQFKDIAQQAAMQHEAVAEGITEVLQRYHDEYVLPIKHDAIASKDLAEVTHRQLPDIREAIRQARDVADAAEKQSADAQELTHALRNQCVVLVGNVESRLLEQINTEVGAGRERLHVAIGEADQRTHTRFLANKTRIELLKAGILVERRRVRWALGGLTLLLIVNILVQACA